MRGAMVPRWDGAVRNGEVCEPRADDAGRRREQRAFGEELAAAMRGPEAPKCEADRGLALPAHRARQEQVEHIGQCHGHHERDARHAE